MLLDRWNGQRDNRAELGTVGGLGCSLDRFNRQHVKSCQETMTRVCSNFLSLQSASVQSLRPVVHTSPTATHSKFALTWLEDQSACYIHISTIARGLDALICANQRAYYERGSLADAVE